MVVNFIWSPKQFKQFKNFDAVVSLGWNCYPGLYLKKYVESAGSIFDYIGSPLSAIIDIITKNWENLFNKEKYTLLDFYKPEHNIERHGKPNNYYVYQHDYQMSFPHDVKTISDVTPEFFSKLKGRIQRFEKYCRSAKKLLFIRLQQNRSGLILEDDDTIKPEIELLPSFIELIKSKYDRKHVNMIFINNEKDGWNEDKTILFVKIDSLYFKWQDAADIIHNLFIKKNVYSELASI